MFIEISQWDVLCTRHCFINPYNKPFGAKLPIEVQNRIMWMVWKRDHKEQSAAFRQELVTLPKCVLSDWVGTVSMTKPFNSAWWFTCNGDEVNHPITCHWCLLYAKKHESIEVKVVDRKLTRKCNEISCYDNDAYDRVTRQYLPLLADPLQYTLSYVILPLLKWINPRKIQMGYALFPQQNTSFFDVLLAYQALVQRCIELSGTARMMNPRICAQEHFEKIRGQQLDTRLGNKIKKNK